MLESELKHGLPAESLVLITVLYYLSLLCASVLSAVNGSENTCTYFLGCWETPMNYFGKVLRTVQAQSAHSIYIHYYHSSNQLERINFLIWT